jgi:hypothetical protein
MTVCTNDLALVDLPKHVVPSATPQPRRDGELLVGEVIELQHDRVGLSAVDARSLAKKPDEEPHPLGYEHLFSACRCCEVTLAVGERVLAFVRGSARAAVGVALSAVAAVPGKC